MSYNKIYFSAPQEAETGWKKVRVQRGHALLGRVTSGCHAYLSWLTGLDTLTPPPPLGLNPSLNLARLSSVPLSMLTDFFSAWK